MGTMSEAPDPGTERLFVCPPMPNNPPLASTPVPTPGPIPDPNAESNPSFELPIPGVAPLKAAISCLFGPESPVSERPPPFMLLEDDEERLLICENGEEEVSDEPAPVCI